MVVRFLFSPRVFSVFSDFSGDNVLHVLSELSFVAIVSLAVVSYVFVFFLFVDTFFLLPTIASAPPFAHIFLPTSCLLICFLSASTFCTSISLLSNHQC